MSSLRNVCWCLGLIAAAGLSQHVRAGDLQIIQESSSYSGSSGNFFIDTGKWSTDGTSSVKVLNSIVAKVDLKNPEVLLLLTDAANANGLSEFADLFLDMFAEVSNGNGDGIAKLNQRLVDLTDIYNSVSVDGGSNEGGVAAPPANDLCAGVITVAIPSSTAGTLVESTIDAAPACSVCQTTGGVWYKVVGTGNRISASLCNAATGFDSKLSVYTGTCAGLVCLDGNDDLGTTGAAPFSCVSPGGSRSGVTWCSTLGTEYYILVHSFSSLATFQLDLSQDATACTIPANDNCSSPVTVTQASLPFTDTGVVYRQAHDDVDVTCDNGTCPVSRRGVWYTYTPTSATSLVISTSTTGTFKGVFVGSCGGLTQLVCSTAQTVGISGFSPGTTYLILVGHTSDFSEPTAAMNVIFTLPPANDLCPDAITVAVGSSTTGTTVNSLADGTAACGGISNTQAGVWYRVVGNGNTLTADTCAAGAAGSLADTRVTVFTCGCPCKTCVAGNDTASPTCTGFTARARVSWCSEVGKEYLILVHQGTATAGTFRLDVTNGASCSSTVACTAPANDECGGGTVVVNGANAFTNAGACIGTDAKCDGNLSADVWYNYTATCTGDATIDTCGGVANNGPDTVLQVYNGCTCPPVPVANPAFCADDSASCGTSGFASRVTIPVTSGNCYKIRLANYSSAGTTFALVAGTLQISCAPAGFCGDGIIQAGEQCDGAALGPCVHGCSGSCQCLPPANNDCANGSSASDGVNSFNRAFATTDGAAQPNPPCDFPVGDDQIYSDVWFNYTASCTGRLFTDTCNGVGIDTRIAVYSGCSCPVGADPLSCNDDSGATDEMSDPDNDPDLCNQAGASPYESATRNQVVQGQCYKIRVGSFGATDSTAGVDELFIQCITKGSCCDALGACTEGVIPSQCSTGFHSGADCVVESCCLNGNCGLMAPECCTDLGGTPGGPGSTCNNCGNGIVNCGEQCDGGACCTAQCTYVAAGTTCRGSAGVCDVAEACDGASSACPADGYSSGNLCRGAADVCDAPESCDGSGPNCPADLFLTGNLCRGVAGVCDAPESCNGSGPACPPDLFLSGNSCRNSSGPCDPAESCSGSGPDCPPDQTITSCINNDGCCPSNCNGNNDNDCPPVAIPTVSEWGLVFLTLIGMVVGSVVFRRRAIQG